MVLASKVVKIDSKIIISHRKTKSVTHYVEVSNATVHIKVLGKLDLVIRRLKLISTTAPAASKNDARFKSGQI